MASVSELLSIFESTEDLAEAEDALERIAAMERPPDLELGECYDNLAEAAADDGDLELAIRAERRALEHGCRAPELAREMVGWYLLESGERTEGEAVFAALREERPDDPWLLSALGAARRGSGDLPGALRAYEEALALAKAGSDRILTRRLRAERWECRQDQGLEPDEEDCLVESANSDFPDADAFAVAWFPREEIEAALERWPSLAGDLTDSDAYCRTIEERLRELRTATGRVPSVAPMEVERSCGSPPRTAWTQTPAPRGAASRLFSAAAARPCPGHPAGTTHAGAAPAASTSAAAPDPAVRRRRQRPDVRLQRAAQRKGLAVLPADLD